jgi:hypothetical protein
VKHFGSVRDLHEKSGSMSSTPTLGGTGMNGSPLIPLSSPSQAPGNSQQTWIPPSSQIQKVTPKLPATDETSKEKPPAPAPKGKGAQKRNTEKAERVLKRIRKEQSEWDGVMSEEMMWGLLEDDSFVAEVLSGSCFIFSFGQYPG